MNRLLLLLRQRARHCALAGAVLLVVLIAACQLQDTAPSEDAVAAAPARPVKLLTLGDPQRAQLISLPGQVEASSEVQISFRVPGQLEALPVQEGDRVEPGQLLARLDQRDYRNQLADREAGYEIKRIDYQRIRALRAKRVSSEAELDAARAAYRSAEAALKLAQDQLAYTELRAPFAGRIARKSVENFQYLQAQQTVLLLQADHELDIAVELPEAIISRIDPVRWAEYRPEARFAAEPDQTHGLRFKEQATQAAAGTQSYRTVFTLTAPQTFTLLPGMAATVTLDLAVLGRAPGSAYQLIPLAALEERDGQARVWRFDPASASVQPVTVALGAVTDAGIEVRSGLAPGDQLVLSGLSQLTPGQKVRPLRRERGL